MARNRKNLFTNSNTKTNNLDKYFTNFVVYSLTLLFLILIGYSLIIANNYKDYNSVNITILGIYVVLTGTFIFMLNRRVNSKKILISVLCIGFILRLTWALITPSVPVSDFETMYTTGLQFLNGDNSAFTGLGYLARFPHMMPYSLFHSLFIKIFGGNSLFALKMLNVILSTLSIYLVYLICKAMFNDTTRTLIGTFIMAILPASILYVPVYCSENIAIPLYLLSIYLFILVIHNEKNPLLLLLCGFLLSIGHLFRMVAYIPLIAYIMYILIYDNKKILSKLINILLITVPFIITFVIVGNTLVSLNITDVKLWSGSEPSNLTSAVRGSNIESGGAWNPEDAKFMADLLEDREALEKACKETIIHRYTTTPPLTLANFFLRKFTSQWGHGDNAGAYWSEQGLSKDQIKFDISAKGTSACQLIYFVLLILILIGLIRKKYNSNTKIINLFYIILCGFGVAFLILETQNRYAFIISFAFAIMPVAAFDSDSYSRY